MLYQTKELRVNVTADIGAAHINLSAVDNKDFMSSEQLEEASWNRLAQLKILYLKQLGYEVHDFALYAKASA